MIAAGMPLPHLNLPPHQNPIHKHTCLSPTDSLQYPPTKATIPPTVPQTIESAYRHCQRIARNHYENFPVASLAIPRKMRPAVAAIYAFARGADDFADEGDHTPAQRLALLNRYTDALHTLQGGGEVDDPVFIALNDTIGKHQLPWTLFHDLLTAFKMDVTTTRYATFDEVLNYCRYSANPVGRLVLHLFNQATPDNCRMSDNICSALQLINFWQDLAQDYDENNRIYVPLNDMQRHTVSEDHFRSRRSDNAMHRLMALQRQRTRMLLEEGAPLAYQMKGRLGLQLRLTVLGGGHVLDAVERLDNLFARPRLRINDWLVIIGDTLWPIRHRQRTKPNQTWRG